MNVLGIDVGSSLVQRWARWLAPACQPFFLTAGEAVELGLTPDRPPRPLSAELRDTYEVWNLPQGSDVVWLDDHAFHTLPRPVRAELVRAQLRHGRGAVPAISGWADIIDAQVLREQADGHHFVWWPALVEPRAEAVLERILLDDGHLPCRRTSVPVDVWRAAAPTLPHARALSGTFANGSGANCFGTGMAAAGVQEAAETWMFQEPFEAWLAANCTAGGRDDHREPCWYGAPTTGPASTPRSPWVAAGACTNHHNHGPPLAKCSRCTTSSAPLHRESPFIGTHCVTCQPPRRRRAADQREVSGAKRQRWRPRRTGVAYGLFAPCCCRERGRPPLTQADEPAFSGRMRRGFLIHPPHMIGGMALRLVQVNFKARDDSALGQFWAEALGWGVSSEGPGVTNLEPEGFAWPDPDAFYCPQGQESRAQTHGQSQSQSQSRHHGQDQKIPIRCQDRKGLRTWFPQLNDLPALAPAGHEAAAQR